MVLTCFDPYSAVENLLVNLKKPCIWFEFVFSPHGLFSSLWIFRCFTNLFFYQLSQWPNPFQSVFPPTAKPLYPTRAQSLRTAPRPHGHRSCARWHAPLVGIFHQLNLSQSFPNLMFGNKYSNFIQFWLHYFLMSFCFIIFLQNNGCRAQGLRRRGLIQQNVSHCWCQRLLLLVNTNWGPNLLQFGWP